MPRDLKALVILIALLALPLLSACNTISGAGEDVSAAGSGISDAADDSDDDGGGY